MLHWQQETCKTPLVAPAPTRSSSCSQQIWWRGRQCVAIWCVRLERDPPVLMDQMEVRFTALTTFFSTCMCTCVLSVWALSTQQAADGSQHIAPCVSQLRLCMGPSGFQALREPFKAKAQKALSCVFTQAPGHQAAFGISTQRHVAMHCRLCRRLPDDPGSVSHPSRGYPLFWGGVVPVHPGHLPVLPGVCWG